MATTPVEQATIRELQTAIADGSTTRLTIITSELERIGQINPLINGFVELRSDDVLREAAEADAELGRTIGGPLDGVPTSVKDSFSVAGLARTDGLVVNKDARDAQDDLVVQRIRAAGGLILGHAAIPDLCIRWNTISGLYGTTRNPRDLTRSAGGSSGGDAANVAAGLATIGIGGDSGGSLRVPASFCGIYGFRPGAGRVPEVNRNSGATNGLTNEVSGMTNEVMSEIGPLARNVADIETTFRVLAGFDRRDPASVPAPLVVPEELPTVAVLRHETGASVDPEISERLDETVEMLSAAGYEVVENVLPDLSRAPEVWAEIVGTELLQDHLPTVGQYVLESGRVHIEEMFGAFNLGSDVAEYLARWRERRLLQGVLFEAMAKYPLILTPVAGMPTPLLNFDDHIGRDASVALFNKMRCIPWVPLFSLPSLALPNGIQIVGRRFEELSVLQAGAAAERLLPPMTVADPRA